MSDETTDRVANENIAFSYADNIPNNYYGDVDIGDVDHCTQTDRETERH